MTLVLCGLPLGAHAAGPSAPAAPTGIMLAQAAPDPLAQSAPAPTPDAATGETSPPRDDATPSAEPRGAAQSPRPTAPAPAADAATGESGQGAAASDREAKLEARLAKLEARLAALDAAKPAARNDGYPRWSFSGGLQPQFLTTWWNADGSPNRQADGLPLGVGPNSVTVRPDGSTTNTTVFRMRRSRLRFSGEMTPAMRMFAEIDLLPVGTGDIFLRNVLSTGIARWNERAVTEFSAGAFKVPLTEELIEGSRDRPFIERSLKSVAFFPGDRDMGVWTRTVVDKKLVVDASVINGRAFGEMSTGFLPDWNRSKDMVLHASYNFGPARVGAGAYLGWGQLTDASNGRYANYLRNALHLETGLQHTFWPKLGESRVYADITYGQNMDRGMRYAFAKPQMPEPGQTAETLHQLGGMLRVEQDITKSFLLGARYESYTTNLALADNFAQQIGALYGFNLTDGLALRVEHFHGVDQSHAEDQEAPTRVYHTFTTWLQARYD